MFNMFWSYQILWCEQATESYTDIQRFGVSKMFYCKKQQQKEY